LGVEADIAAHASIATRIEYALAVGHHSLLLALRGLPKVAIRNLVQLYAHIYRNMWIKKRFKSALLVIEEMGASIYCFKRLGLPVALTSVDRRSGA